MFEDFDSQNNQKQEDDEDTETSSYSYPSYSRFTYTGKTKRPTLQPQEDQGIPQENRPPQNFQSAQTPPWSLGLSRLISQSCKKHEPPRLFNSRLGRNRFMKQTGTKDEAKKVENDSIKSSDVKSNGHFLQTNSQIAKTPGVSWLQRDASLPSHPFTPGGKSSNVHGSYSDVSSLPSQANFLFNLRNDSVQSSTCKRNLPFSTTPFKSKATTSENQSNNNPLRELNQLYKPENPFSKLDFFNRPKEENKENDGKTISEKVKNNELNPSWNQLKKICDAVIPCPDLPKDTSVGDAVDMRKSSNNFKSSLFAVPFSVAEKKDDDSSNMPLDLSSAESTTNKTFSRSLNSGGDNVDGDSSGSLNRLLRDTSKESVSKSDESNTNRTNTDGLSGFLPDFLVPKNKNYKAGSNEDDDSAHSVGTVVERLFDFQAQTPFQKSHKPTQDFNKTPSEYCGEVNRGNEVHPSSQYESSLNNDVKKSSPPSLPMNFTFNGQSPPLQTDQQVQSSNKPKLYHNSEHKRSLPPVLGNVALEPPKLSPPSAQSVCDVRNMVTNGQHILNNEQSYQIPVNEREINSLVQSTDMKLDIFAKSSNEQLANQLEKNVGHSKNANSFNFTNEINGFSQSKSDIKLADNLNPLVNNQQHISSDKIQRNSMPFNSLYQTEARPESSTMEKKVDKLSVQEPKTGTVDQGQSALYVRTTDNVQPPQPIQRTYLAPQQPLSHNSVGSFPHVKPEVPQLASANPNFSTAKKPSQFKMAGPRGMPSRADTELTVSGKSYTILSMLGKGGSSEVYQVLDPCSSKLLAVKCVDLSMVDKTIADGYLNEIDLLSRLQGCASVIRMFDYEYVQECKMLYVVMEKGDTDLSHLIRDISKTKKISMSMIIYYWTEMLQAVKDIHDQGIIHSDLKPANFLLVSGRLKLIDFGIASSQGDMTSVVKEVTMGTWNYMSPEAIKNTSASGKGFKITYKSDVWSLGCILYNLVYRKTPFSHITNTWGKLSAIADPNHCIEFPDVGAPAVLVKALQSCFHREPKLRPTVAELLSLPYHSTGDGGEVNRVGQQVQALLPALWWQKVAHLFPGVRSNQEGKQ